MAPRAVTREELEARRSKIARDLRQLKIDMDSMRDNHGLEPSFDFDELVEDCNAILRGEIVHGVNCQKVEHNDPAFTFEHLDDDDGPYPLCGVFYCGRCHHRLPKGLSGIIT